MTQLGISLAVRAGWTPRTGSRLLRSAERYHVTFCSLVNHGRVQGQGRDCLHGSLSGCTWRWRVEIGDRMLSLYNTPGKHCLCAMILPRN